MARKRKMSLNPGPSTGLRKKKKSNPLRDIKMSRDDAMKIWRQKATLEDLMQRARPMPRKRTSGVKGDRAVPTMAKGGKVKSMIPNESPMPALDQVSYEEAGDFVSKPKVSKPKIALSKAKEKKMTKMPKKESRWSKFKSKFKAKKVEKPKAKKRNIVNIKKMQDDTPTGIKKKKISDWQGKKTKLTAKQKKAKADAYKSPMTGVEKAAAKKKGITKADQYSPVDQSKGVSKAKTVTRKDTTVKTKGGDFPKYRKDTTSSKSFSKAFNEARNPKSGKMSKTFTWQGRTYSTRKAGEGKNFDSATGKWGKAKKMQQGGMVDIPETQAFKQGIRYMKSGGRVSVSNDNAGAGDIAHVHSHLGYKAGE